MHSTTGGKLRPSPRLPPLAPMPRKRVLPAPVFSISVTAMFGGWQWKSDGPFALSLLRVPEVLNEDVRARKDLGLVPVIPAYEVGRGGRDDRYPGS